MGGAIVRNSLSVFLLGRQKYLTHQARLLESCIIE